GRDRFAGPAARHARRADPPHPRLGAAPRLRHRALAGGRHRRRARDRRGVALPVALSHGAARLGGGELGDVGAGAPGQGLPAHRRGARAARAADRAVGRVHALGGARPPARRGAHLGAAV
ncbi:MAG: Transcriptional regulator, PadR family, partial [uncultured Gemmatimonadaceae bacterium]